MFNYLERECIIESLKDRIFKASRNIPTEKQAQNTAEAKSFEYWEKERDAAHTALAKIRAT